MQPVFCLVAFAYIVILVGIVKNPKAAGLVAGVVQGSSIRGVLLFIVRLRVHLCVCLCSRILQTMPLQRAGWRIASCCAAVHCSWSSVHILVGLAF
jgi:hypothetical protein